MKHFKSLRAGLFALAGVATVAMGQIQETRHNPIFIQREANAPAAVKSKLQQMRRAIQTNRQRFTVGFTFADEHPLIDITGGARITDPNVYKTQKPISDKIAQLDRTALQNAIKANPKLKLQIPILRISPKPTDQKLDWRKFGMVTGVRRQLKGTCWAYASVAALEASSLLLNNQKIDASEQYVITNAIGARVDPNNFNGGGWAYKAVDYLVKKGTVTEASCPDTGTAGTANPNAFKPYGGINWGFCHNSTGMATKAEIKQALCEHGPLATWIDAGGTFGSYTSGVYDDTSTNHTVGGHFVLIVGWDETKSAWLIKNSWGTTWGDTCGFGTETGYAFVGYGVHGIGTDACWIHDHPTKYKINFVDIAKILKVGTLGHAKLGG